MPIHNSIKYETPEFLKQAILSKVQNSVLVFRNAPKELKEEASFIRQAASRNPKILRYVSLNTYANNPKLAEDLVLNNSDCFESLPVSVKRNIPLICTLLDEGVDILNEIDSSLYDNPLVCKALIDGGFSTDWVSDRLKDDETFCKYAIKSNLENFEYIDNRLKYDPFFIKSVLEEELNLINDIPSDISNYPEMVALFIRQSPEIPVNVAISVLYKKTPFKELTEIAIKSALDEEPQERLMNHIQQVDDYWVTLETTDSYDENSLNKIRGEELITPLVIERLNQENLAWIPKTKHITEEFSVEVARRKLLAIPKTSSVKGKPKRRGFNNAY